MDTLMVKFVGLARQTQLPDVGVAEFVGPARQTYVKMGCVKKICRPGQTNSSPDIVCGRFVGPARQTYVKRDV